MAIKDITGERYGRLVAVKHIGLDENKDVIWQWKCDCGNMSRQIVSGLQGLKIQERDLWRQTNERNLLNTGC